MKRGEIWTAIERGDFVSKPRPVIILQSDLESTTDSITVCPLTTDLLPLKRLRITLMPDESNGLREESQVMVDKITTVRKVRIGQQVGVLSDPDIVLIDRAILVHLGFAGRTRLSIQNELT